VRVDEQHAGIQAGDDLGAQSATGLFVARASIPATAPSATLHCQNSAPLAGNWRMVARSPSDAWPR
jgi:hypothetical protein